MPYTTCVCARTKSRSQAGSVYTRLCIFTALLFTFFFIAFPSIARATTLTASWSPNPEPNIAGYRLLVGTASGSYTTVIDVGKVTSYSFSVNAGATYYCVLQAYNTAGQSSPWSAEVVVSVPGQSGGSGSGGGSGGSSGGGASGGGGGTSAGVWSTVGVGDFNGDGHADVLWFNANTGALAEWVLDGQGNVIAAPNLSLTCGSGCSPPWQVVGVGDFNGDGHADVLWFNANTGTLAEWLLDGQGHVMATPNLSLTCGSGCSPPWQVLGVGDFNGDGHADVLWFNANTGTLAEWLLDGQGHVIAAPNLSLTCGSGCSR